MQCAVVETARSAIRYDERFGEFYGRVKVHRGDQKAVIAMANKMLKVVWVMLVRRETYKWYETKTV